MRRRKELANALRILAIDAIEAAKSGHPGAPMGMADMAEALWRGGFKHNPANPAWADRDRFVLSNGHASMLLYGLLHLTGYDLSMDDIRAFRQLGSRTPGHPEHGVTPGVEMTTGPLGQGLATGVGMALAEKVLAATFNRPELSIVDHFTYVFVGDGCLMEGISHEACSLAGTLGLGKLIVLYDANGISIDGEVKDWFADDTPERFAACGWNVIRDVDGHDGEALDAALTLARAIKKQPSLICCRTVIGYGAPNKAGTNACHGSPLGQNEARATRLLLGWEGEPFSVPDDMYAEWDARAAGHTAEAAWTTRFEAYRAAYPDLAAEFERRMAGELPSSWDATIRQLIERMKTAKPMATRQASGDVLAAMAATLPELFGGSADLTGSVNTRQPDAVSVTQSQWPGTYLSYGVREFLMACMMNGLALHGGFIPYGGTFLVFSDYMRPAVRLGTLMGQRSIFVLTHDSIGVGEDGPTHQPVEHVPSLRLIPGLRVWRPADAVETAVAWKAAIESVHMPSALILSRQSVPPLAHDTTQLTDIERGGYILHDCPGTPEVILLATGSEVQLAMAAAAQLERSGRGVRVVSMPCTEAFDAQDSAWREHVLPAAVRARVAVEAAAADGWWKYTGLDGQIVGMHSFGASAPGTQLFDHFGLTTDAVVKAAETVVKNKS